MSLAAVAAFAICVYYVGGHFLFYCLGLGYTVGFLIFFTPVVIVPLLLVALAVLTILIVRLFILNIRFGFKCLLLHIFFIAIPIGLLSIVPQFLSTGHVASAEGCLERMKREEADILAIQAWIKTVDLEYLNPPKEGPYRWLVDEPKWPDAVQKLSPGFVYIHKLKNGKIFAKLIYGGALTGHWGLAVGVDTKEIPLNDFYESEYRLELAPNAFIWSGP